MTAADGGQVGVVMGIVCDLDDPLRLGRVRVRYPDLEDQPSDWARLVTPMAGRERGLFLRPELGELVAVTFERGDMRNPLILGGMWSEPDPPPKDDGNATANNWRFLRSRSGHVIKLDDTPGAERIELIDKDGSRKIMLDSAAGTVQVIAEGGEIDVRAGGGTVKVEGATVEISASRNLTLRAAESVAITGATVSINE